MRHLFVIILLFLSAKTQAQFKVSGTTQPETKIDWAMLYRVKNGKGEYVSNSDIEGTQFQFEIKPGMPPGIYRILYKGNDEQFIDFIFNNEDIRFTFDPDNPTETIRFTNSAENQIYQSYYHDILKAQKKLDSIQVAYFKSKDSKLVQAYKQQLENVKKVQAGYEKRAKAKLAYHFIRASRQFNPEKPFESPEAYINAVREHFLDNIDFNNPVLANSPMVNEKLIDYVFYLNQAQTPEKSEILHKFAISRIAELLKGKYDLLKKFYESRIRAYLSENNPKMARYTFETYYLKLPVKFIDPAFSNYIKGELKTSVGTKAPDLKWEIDGKAGSLYGLKDKEYYIIVFFSTGCSHCQKQMPEFYKFIKDIHNIQVITVGLEDELDWWKDMTSKWKGFINIVDLKKWDSPWIKDYGVTATPSYFILNKDKVILAKPNDFEELRSLFSPQ